VRYRHPSYVVVKFFSQFRELHNLLLAMGIGFGQTIPINAEFPPTWTVSSLGFELSEDQLVQR
jgi:hypothetical protein